MKKSMIFLLLLVTFSISVYAQTPVKGGDCPLGTKPVNNVYMCIQDSCPEGTERGFLDHCLCKDLSQKTCLGNIGGFTITTHCVSHSQCCDDRDCQRPKKCRFGGCVIDCEAPLILNREGTECVTREQLEPLWPKIKKICDDFFKNNPHGDRLEMNVDEFLAYLRIFEGMNPNTDWKQHIARLHMQEYGFDLSFSVFGILSLFKHGTETDGAGKLKVPCSIKEKYIKIPREAYPRYVTLNGERIDMAHVYAALRSDLNRGNQFPITKLIMRKVNTDWGDMWQELAAPILRDRPVRFTIPPDQALGNAIGHWLANYYSKNENKQKPLSQAFQDFQNFLHVQAVGGR